MCWVLRTLLVLFLFIVMKISETSWWMFAIVQWVECRLTVKARNRYAMMLKKNKDMIWFYEIDMQWIYRDSSSEAILISPLVNRIENKMRKLWYKDFDYDSKPYALVKCYK